MRKLAKTFISSRIFCLVDTFLAEKLHLRAFTASRKTSHNFSQASRFEQKIRLGAYSTYCHDIWMID